MLSKQEILENVKKLYEDTEDKYIFVINADLWYFYDENITGNITLHTTDGDIVLENTNVIRPYLNRTLNNLSLKIGNNCSNLGIPLLFDSFEDLQKIKQVEIRWTILGKAEICVMHDVNFIDDVNSKTYLLETVDYAWSMLDSKEKEKRDKYVKASIEKYKEIFAMYDSQIVYLVDGIPNTVAYNKIQEIFDGKFDTLEKFEKECAYDKVYFFKTYNELTPANN